MRVKEYLSIREIEYESINVFEENGASQLAALGARSVPVVSRNGQFVYAQVMKDVVDFLQLDDDTGPVLTPQQLADRYTHVLDTAVRLTRQMPQDCLARELPNRPRSWRVLLHHVFQIPVAFLDMESSGETLSYENMVAPPPDDMISATAIADFGSGVQQRFCTWWNSAQGADFTCSVPTYFGTTSRHEMLERTVWHSTQHVRQVASLLEQAGVTPDRPLTGDDITGLPLTDVIWDS